MLNYKGKFCSGLLEAFTAQGYTINPDGFEGLIYNEVAMQAIIDEFPEPMPNLKPMQFGYMLTRFGFKPAINSLLESLEVEDQEKHAIYDAYLDKADFYEFELTLAMFNDVRQKFKDFNSELDFTTDQLKQMWLIASQV